MNLQTREDEDQAFVDRLLAYLSLREREVLTHVIIGRRNKQIAWNEKMGITPMGVQKRIKDLIDGVYDAEEGRKKLRTERTRAKYETMPEKDMEKELKHLERDMLEAAKNLEFEKAAQLRDRLLELKEAMFGVALPADGGGG